LERLATKAGGKYANIDQDRVSKAVAIQTPHDKDLLKLNDKLNDTYVAYGKEGKMRSEIRKPRTRTPPRHLVSGLPQRHSIEQAPRQPRSIGMAPGTSWTR